MKKLVVSLLVLIASTVTVASAITVNDGKTSPSSCNNAESHDYYYYFQSNNNKLTYNNINDTYWDQVNAFIRNDSSVEIYRNWIISQCSNWERVSNIVRWWGDVRNQYPATVLRNNDGCVFNKPTYIKDENNPAAIDAQIHFTIGVNVLASSKWNGHDKINEGKFYYKSWSSFYCYPTWEQKSSNSECAKASSYYWEEADLHTWECLNYRVFRCGDWLVNWRNKNWTTITNYNNTSYTEQCDPNHPDWKNWKAWQTCNPNTCKIEYTTAECGSLNSNNPIYNSNYPTPRIANSTPWLCGVWTLSWNVSYDKDAWKYTWKCVNGNSQPVVCEAKDLWCGDGNLQEDKGEECDEWKDNGKTGSSCTSDCKKVPQCSSQYNGKNIYTSNSSSVIDSYVDKSKLCEVGIMFPSTFSPNQWTPWNPRVFYWWCKNGEKTISEKACQLNQYRCWDGIKNGWNPTLFINNRTIEACDPADPNLNEKCNNDCTYANAVCGLESGQTKYNNNYPAPRIKETDSWLCGTGKVKAWSFVWPDSNGKYTWECINGTKDASCNAQDLRCGDSKVTDGEQCDPKDTRDPSVKWWW